MTLPSDSSPGAEPPREWDAQSYHTVSEPQFEWGKRVLASLALRGDERVMDAGCGTGRLTRILAGRVPRGEVVAIDRSVNMIQVARETLASEANVHIAAADLSSLPFSDAFDVIFSTATFHWIRDHDRLFANLFAALRDGGRLHAQCGGGRNLERIHHRALELAASAESAPFFSDWRDPWEYASAEVTRERLARNGFREIHVGIEESPVTFPNANAFREFITTVVMRPFVARLPDSTERAAFLDRIVDLASRDTPPYTLDYWRLNLSARR
jgi:trans-aconitate 2-methyltransferase